MDDLEVTQVEDITSTQVDSIVGVFGGTQVDDLGGTPVVAPVIMQVDASADTLVSSRVEEVMDMQVVVFPGTQVDESVNSQVNDIAPGAQVAEPTDPVVSQEDEVATIDGIAVDYTQVVEEMVPDELDMELRHDDANAEQAVPQMVAIPNIGLQKVAFTKPVRLIRPNKVTPMMALIEKSLIAAMGDRASESQVRAFLLCPSLVNLTLPELAILVNMADITPVLDHAWNVFIREDRHQRMLPGPANGNDLPEGVAKKCSLLIHANRVGAATRKLESWASKDTPADLNDPAVLDQIRTLHPPASDDDRLPLPPVNLPEFELDEDVINLILLALPNQSGGGIYPWTNELIKMCYRHSPRLATLIRAFLLKMVNGRLQHKSLWLASKLVVIKKANGKLRPIAISDPWIRLAGRLLCHVAIPECDRYLGPMQLGINKRGGAEIMVHSAQVMKEFMSVAGNSEHGILSLDCSNAFNSIRRSYISTGVSMACPRLLHYFNWAYDSAVSLNASLGAPCAESCSGVRQGDPLGPLLFCLGTSHTFNTVAQEFNVHVGMSAFLDDITVMGPNGHLMTVFRTLQRRFSTLGLKFNAEKSSLFTPSLTFNTGDTRIPVVHDGVVVLGVPIGSDAFVSTALDKLLVEQTSILDKLPIFKVPERVPILRSSVNARPMYHVRNLPTALTADFSREFDKRTLAALCAIIGVDSESFPASSVDVKHLPTHHGGIGITSVHRVRQAAYLASLVESLRYLKSKCPWVYDKLPAFTLLDPQLLRLLPTSPAIRPNTPVNQLVDAILVANPTLVRQKDITAKSDTSLFNSLVNRLWVSDKPSALMLQSNATKGISAWLFSACQDNQHLLVPEAEYRESLRLRLLVPVFTPVEQLARRCPTCRIENVGSFHALTCKMFGECRKRRHDLIVTAIGKFVKTCFPAARAQLPYEIPGHRGGGNALVADAWFVAGDWSRYVDVVVTSPAVSHAQDVQRLPAAGKAGREAAARKKDKYRGKYADAVFNQVVPFAIEASGRLCLEAAAFVDMVVDRAADRPTAIQARLHLFARLGKLLATGNGKLVLLSRDGMLPVPRRPPAPPNIVVPPPALAAPPAA